MTQMKKTVKVVMLPTNEKANALWWSGHFMYTRQPEDPIRGELNHLYFLSDEEIKKGDWIYDVCDGIVKVEHEYQLSNMMVFRKDCKKIIATTDDLLFTEYDPKTSSVEDEYYLPEPPQSFIEYFVEEYNKGNVITEVEVEYDRLTSFWEREKDGLIVFTEKEMEEVGGVFTFYEGNKLKINPDNTINIKPKKDSWSREEVIEFARRYAKRCQAPMTDTKWLEENLYNL